MNVTPVTPSGISLIDALLYGDQWGTQTGSGIRIGYSFPYTDFLTASWPTYYSVSNEPWGYPIYGLNGEQRNAARQAIQLWANVADISFAEIEETFVQYGDIRFTFIEDPAAWDTWGWTYLPSSATAAGDVWINGDVYSDDWSVGSYNFFSLIHEIGHALGLKHSFEDGTVLPAVFESQQYTVMSYTEHPHAAYDCPPWIYDYVRPSTPMLLDIAAIQHLYGANTSYRNGDDTYTFDPDTPFFMTLWDAGGHDTISVAGFTRGCAIDLNPLAFSSIAVAVPPVSDPYVEGVYDGTDNLAIAWGTVIENAVGGNGNDVFIGNGAANILDGGGGIDTVFYNGNRSGFDLVGTNGAFTCSSPASGIDTLLGMERLSFLDLQVALDLEGNAGIAAKVLGAIGGAGILANREVMRVGIELVDGGMSSEELADLALTAVGAHAPFSAVQLLWTNLFGDPPTVEEAQPLVDILDAGIATVGVLGAYVAETEWNAHNINLLGLAVTGIEF